MTSQGQDKSPVDKLWLGVDWGTHSSKWVCSFENGETLTGKIHSSTLVRVDNDLIFPEGDKIPDGGEKIDSLKGTIIRDPMGQSFWDADRADTNSTLGEAVSFSFCCLLCDITRELSEEKGLSLTPDISIEIGFSLPNWLRDLDKKSKAALVHFQQAVNISCWIYRQTYGRDLPIPGKPFPIKDWKLIIKNARKNCMLGDAPVLVKELTEKVYSLDTLKWGYLVESCAAGLPYLRSITTLMEKDSPPGLQGLGKLLVVDVGAGSTDVGYMLRTISLKKRENLFYFTPAGTFGIAGNELTERVWEYFQQQGRRLTREDAEVRKLSDSKWYNLEFANEWRQQIRRHVREYVRGIPDGRWLPIDVPLQIVVTGGSGVVSGLRDEIKKGVRDGLKDRGVQERAVGRAILISEKLPVWGFAQEAEYGRRAVSIGAADTNKPALKYCAKLDRPTRVETKTIRF